MTQFTLMFRLYVFPVTIGIVCLMYGTRLCDPKASATRFLADTGNLKDAPPTVAGWGML